MIIIINGSLGVGKSSVAASLLWKYTNTVNLDGDSLCDINPFEIYDRKRIDNLYKIFAMLVSFYIRNGYKNIIINYVFENADELARLVKLLRPMDDDIYTFLLLCEEKEQRKRIKKRGRKDIKWELRRFVELRKIQSEAAGLGYLGEVIDTTNSSSEEVAGRIDLFIQSKKL